MGEHDLQPASTAGAALSERTGRVLALGSDTRAFLAVIRSLGRRGLEVHVAWCPAESVSLRSRYVHRVHALPSPETAADIWVPEFRALLAHERFDLVIPCSDQVQIPLQTHREEIESWGCIYLLHDRAFRVVSDKMETCQLAESLGVPIPAGLVVRSTAEIPEALTAFDYPVVIKPRASFTEDDLSNRNWVTRARTPEVLRERLEALLPRGPVLVQENFIGFGVGIELLAWRGEPLVVFQHERVHEPLEGGGSTYRRSVAPHPALQEAATRLIAALDYTGVAMVEFKMNRSTGLWVLMEINGRFWGSLPLAVAAGADFPAYLYEMWVEGRRDFPRGYRQGLYCRNLRSDLRWNWINLHADHRDPTLHTLSPRAVIGELGNWLAGRERFDTLTFDDPNPGLAELGALLADCFRIVGQHVRQLVDAVPARRAVRFRRAKKAARGARRVLFVCFGNICRSPFALERARRLLDSEVILESAGTHPVAGRPSPGEAVQAARAFDVDLSTHRSNVVSAEQVERADLILTFDEKNRRELTALFPGARARIQPLGVFGDDSSNTIADPYGGDADRFVAIYRKIDRALVGLSVAIGPDGDGSGCS